MSQDRWQPAKGWLVEPGLRFDWDEIMRRALVAPRLAAVYSPPGDEDKTKISAGIGTLLRAHATRVPGADLAGIRYDTYYETDGATPTGPAQETDVFREPRRAARAAGVELERGRGAQTAVVDRCRREFHGEADVRMCSLL